MLKRPSFEFNINTSGVLKNVWTNCYNNTILSQVSLITLNFNAKFLISWLIATTLKCKIIWDCKYNRILSIVLY